jgi:hypothetical protein
VIYYLFYEFVTLPAYQCCSPQVHAVLPEKGYTALCFLKRLENGKAISKARGNGLADHYQMDNNGLLSVTF